MARLEAPVRALGADVGRGMPAVPATTAEPVAGDAFEESAFVPEVGPAETGSPLAKGDEANAPKKRPKAKRDAKAKAEGPSVYISEKTILRLANARAVPASLPVGATEEHPAGLQLLGVSALGVGMQDGDVITEVAGRRIRGETDIVGIVLAARAQQAPTISAVFYRGKTRGTLTVAMPYLAQ